MDKEILLKWKNVHNSVKNRLEDKSLIHLFSITNKCMKSTKAFNEEIKCRGNKSYKQFLECKTKILDKVKENLEFTDESDLTDNDYILYYKSFEVSNNKVANSLNENFAWLYIDKESNKQSDKQQLNIVNCPVKKSGVINSSKCTNIVKLKTSDKKGNIDQNTIKTATPKIPTNVQNVENVATNLPFQITNNDSKTDELFMDNSYDELISFNVQAESTKIFSDTFTDAKNKCKRNRRSSKYNLRYYPKDSGIDEDSREDNTKHESYVDIVKTDDQKIVNAETINISENINEKTQTKLNKAQNSNSNTYNVESIQANNVKKKKVPIKMIVQEKFTKKYKIINNKENISNLPSNEKITELKFDNKMNESNTFANKTFNNESENDHKCAESHNLNLSVSENKHNEENNDFEEKDTKIESTKELTGKEGQDFAVESTNEELFSSEIELDNRKLQVRALKKKLKKTKSGYLAQQYKELKQLKVLSDSFEDSDSQTSNIHENKFKNHCSRSKNTDSKDKINRLLVLLDTKKSMATKEEEKEDTKKSIQNIASTSSYNTTNQNMNDDEKEISPSYRNHLQQMKKLTFFNNSEDSDSSTDQNTNIINKSEANEENSTSIHKNKYNEQIKPMDLLSNSDIDDSFDSNDSKNLNSTNSQIIKMCGNNNKEKQKLLKNDSICSSNESFGKEIQSNFTNIVHNSECTVTRKIVDFKNDEDSSTVNENNNTSSSECSEINVENKNDSLKNIKLNENKDSDNDLNIKDNIDTIDEMRRDDSSLSENDDKSSIVDSFLEIREHKDELHIFKDYKESKSNEFNTDINIIDENKIYANCNKDLKISKNCELEPSDIELSASEEIDPVHYSSDNDKNDKESNQINFNSDKDEEMKNVNVDTLSPKNVQSLKNLKRLNLFEVSEDESETDTTKTMSGQIKQEEIHIKSLDCESEENESNEDDCDKSLSPTLNQRISQFKRINLMTNSCSSSSDEENKEKNRNLTPNIANNSNKSTKYSTPENNEQFNTIDNHEEKINKNSAHNFEKSTKYSVSDNSEEFNLIDKYKETNTNTNSKLLAIGNNQNEINYKFPKDIIIPETQESNQEENILESQEIFSSLENVSKEIDELFIDYNTISNTKEIDQNISNKVTTSEIEENINVKVKEIPELVKKENLLEILCRPTISFKDISSDDDLFIIDVPKNVLNNNLVGKKIILTNNVLALGNNSYEVLHRPLSHTYSCVFKSRKTKKNTYKITNINPVAVAVARKRKQFSSDDDDDSQQLVYLEDRQSAENKKISQKQMTRKKDTSENNQDLKKHKRSKIKDKELHAMTNGKIANLGRETESKENKLCTINISMENDICTDKNVNLKKEDNLMVKVNKIEEDKETKDKTDSELQVTETENKKVKKTKKKKIRKFSENLEESRLKEYSEFEIPTVQTNKKIKSKEKNSNLGEIENNELKEELKSENIRIKKKKESKMKFKDLKNFNSIVVDDECNTENKKKKIDCWEVSSIDSEPINNEMFLEHELKPKTKKRSYNEAFSDQKSNSHEMENKDRITEPSCKRKIKSISIKPKQDLKIINTKKSKVISERTTRKKRNDRNEKAKDSEKPKSALQQIMQIVGRTMHLDDEKDKLSNVNINNSKYKKLDITHSPSKKWKCSYSSSSSDEDYSKIFSKSFQMRNTSKLMDSEESKIGSPSTSCDKKIKKIFYFNE